MNFITLTDSDTKQPLVINMNDLSYAEALLDGDAVIGSTIGLGNSQTIFTVAETPKTIYTIIATRRQ